ncbi:MAG TPA: hypothetical protein DCG89_07280 [Spartobacteria bacterium]|nr:hypothetical protein [Spartobacteria bacterium]
MKSYWQCGLSGGVMNSARQTARCRASMTELPACAGANRVNRARMVARLSKNSRRDWRSTPGRELPVSRRSPTRTSRAHMRFYNEAGRDLMTIIVNCGLPRWLTRYIIATTLLEWKRLPKVNSMFWESRSHAAAKCAKSLIRAIVCYLSRQIGSGSTAKLILVGECLAPDSSRFWPGADYVIVENPLSFDNDSCAIISRRSIGIKSRRRLRCRRM